MGARAVVGAVVVAAVVLAVLLVGTRGDDPSSTPADGGTTGEPADPAVDAETFCTTYAAMATAYTNALGAPGDAALAEAVEERGQEFVDVGRPPGMGAVEDAGRDRFVEDLYVAVGLRDSASAGPGAAEELAAFSRLLTRTCPGY